jgi:hypothetical protein
MGYDLHITRKANRSDDEGDSITPEEWLAVLDSDSELSRATDTGDDTLAGAWKGDSLFWFHDGEITCKNPDEPIIRKMVAIAQRLGANVQGDDGEVYRADGTAPREQRVVAQPGLLQRVRDWFGARRNAREWQSGVPAFRVGSRVHDAVGRHGTVTEVDRHAEHGAGRLSVRFDDGNDACFALIAPGVELDGKRAAE